jgi:prepilin-type N-terminal cleavage/methylation domain-containing protein
MKKSVPKAKRNQKGFSLVEMTVAMTITLILMALVATLFSRALGTRARESRRTDALTSAQAALDVMSREIGNSGYGIHYVNAANAKVAANGLVLADSGQNKIHLRANVENSDYCTASPGEDVTYYFDSTTSSIVRYDANGIPNASPCQFGTAVTSVVVNRISNVTFTYFDYTGSSSTPSPASGSSTPTLDTGRVRINVTVTLDPVPGQPSGTVTLTSDVTLRNSNYMLNQY